MLSAPRDWNTTYNHVDSELAFVSLSPNWAMNQLLKASGGGVDVVAFLVPTHNNLIDCSPSWVGLYSVGEHPLPTDYATSSQDIALIIDVNNLVDIV